MRVALPLPVHFRRLAILALAAIAALVSSCRAPTDPATAEGQTRQRHTLAVALATVPTHFLDAQVASGLATPVAMDFAPDGRLFVCEKGGGLRVVKAGSLLPTAFHRFGVDGSGERGLLGVAFDPDFAAERWVYVYYTLGGSPARNRVSRVRAATAAGDVSDGAEQVLFELSNLSASVIHNGGAIHFGADGKLYIATGENATPANAQSLANTLGKVLRINKDGSIPTDNPFYASATGNNRAIWAVGFRNPFTFAVQPGTGRIFVNDVGQDAYEEVNDLVRGSNYGWPTVEGPTTNPSFRSPIHGYVNQGSDCSIIGAAFYNPSVNHFPSDYVGDFFYGDWCGGYIKRWDPAGGAAQTFATGVVEMVDLKVGPEGALYYAQIGGSIRKVSYTGPVAPTITGHPLDRSAGVGQAVPFTVTASGTGPLAYQWQRNGADIGGATSATYNHTAQAGDNNVRFRCRVANAQGSAVSNEAVLTVTGNRAPVPVINAPPIGATYRGGDAFNYSGSADDPDQGALPASAFTWRVDFHHDEHNHPVVAPISGSTTGSFTAANRGEVSPNVFYRITLTVVDAGGWSATVTRDIQPVKASITLATSPAGMQLRLDGALVTTPHTFLGVAGIIRTIEAVSPQTFNGQSHTFSNWSDGGASLHEIATPAANTTITANYIQSTAGPWTSRDIGAVGPAGSFSLAGATGTIRGSGADIWGAADAFQFAYQTLNGDGQLTARVTALANTDPWAKVGVMIRDGLAAGARHAFMSVTSANGLAFQRREATGGQSLHTGVAGAVPRWIRITRSGSFLRGYQSADGSAWTLVGESNQALPASVLIGMAITSHNNAVLGSATLESLSLVTGPTPVWTAQDIGAVGLAGSTSGTGTLTVRGAGADIYGNADAFHFHHRSLNADGEIRARVNSLTNTHQWAKAGVMIRENTSAGSRHAYMGITPGATLEYLRREIVDGVTTPVGIAGSAPRWVRLVRAGNVITASHSADGVAWTQAGQVTLGLAADVRVGLAVCSHNTAALADGVFDNVTVVD